MWITIRKIQKHNPKSASDEIAGGFYIAAKNRQLKKANTGNYARFFTGLFAETVRQS